MGVVYLARDTKLGRAVALKFLPPQWSHDEGAKQRFLREAQAASATNHRNICIIHDIEQTEDGRLFIVMAYYEGQTLKQRLENGPLPLADALEIATEIAEGLAKAHAQGVVHRDIKPGNLIVTDDGVKILDFGLAKFADALQLTAPGSTIGTVAYMSPEQARGDEADERSDIWALGVVLYEMISGEVPFKGTYAEAIFYAIKNEPMASLASRGRDIPEAVDHLVMRALAKDPAERFQHARELARELRQLQGRSVPLDLRTEPLSVASAAMPAGRRRFTRARAAVAAGVLLAAGAGGYFWFARPVQRVPIAIVPISNHTGEPGLDAYRLALTQSLVAELADSPNLRVSPYQRLLESVRRYIGGPGDVSSREAIQDIAGRTGAMFLVVPALSYRDGAWTATAEIRNVRTGTNVQSVQTDAVASSLPKETAQRLMVSLASLIQDQFPARWPYRAPPARPAGSRFRSLDAARAFEEGLNAHEQLEYAAAREAFGRAVQDDPQRAIGFAWLSRTALLMGDVKAAEAAGRSAIGLATGDLPAADALFAAAVSAESRNDFDTAEQQYREASLARPADSSGPTELADFLKRRGRNEEAVDTYHEVLALDPGFIRINVDLCQIYVRLDDYPLAEKHAQAALESYRAIGNRGGEAQALLCLGDIRRGQGGASLAEARTSIEGARAIFQALDYRYGLSRVYQYLGATAGDAGDYRAAARHFEEALSRSRQVGNRQIEALELMNLGVAYGALGERAEALKYYQQARDFYEQIGDERRAAEQEINAASLLVNSGRGLPEALRRLDGARATLQKLGAVEFDVFGLQVKGVSSVYAGDLAGGTRDLRTALNLAKERHLNNRIVSITVKLAEAAFLSGGNEAARDLLEELLSGDAGRDDEETLILLGRVYGRLGNLARAREHLDRAMSRIEASGLNRLTPSALVALGEVAYASGNLPAALSHFDAAAAAWTDDMPDAASAEAKCFQGAISARSGNVQAGRSLIQTGIGQSEQMGRSYLAEQCRQQLARVGAAH